MWSLWFFRSRVSGTCNFERFFEVATTRWRTVSMLNCMILNFEGAATCPVKSRFISNHALTQRERHTHRKIPIPILAHNSSKSRWYFSKCRTLKRTLTSRRKTLKFRDLLPEIDDSWREPWIEAIKIDATVRFDFPEKRIVFEHSVTNSFRTVHFIEHKEPK